MSIKYISQRRRNYNCKTPECLYSETFSTNCYWCHAAENWFPCKSDYCNIHGLRNRRKKRDRILNDLDRVGLWYGFTIYFGDQQDLAKQQKLYESFKRLLKKPADAILKVNHWKTTKKGRRRHFHVMLGCERLLPLRTIMQAYRKAASSRSVKFNTKKMRLGVRLDANPQRFINYALRTGRRHKVLDPAEFPPPEERWEMMRY